MGSSADSAEVPAGRLEARLLVVEDEPTILELLSGSLRFAGFDVLTAASGREALRVAEAGCGRIRPRHGYAGDIRGSQRVGGDYCDEG